MSAWWDKGGKLPLNEENFQMIINFYLFHCPCEIIKESRDKNSGRKVKKYIKVSQMALTLRAKGWSGEYLKTLLASMKNTISGQLQYYPVSADTDIDEKVKILEQGNSLKDVHYELIIFADRNDMTSKSSAIFYYIRNAFAHGSFSVVSTGTYKVYYLESAKDDIVKARIRLREATLLRWIEKFNESPAELRKELKNGRKKRNFQKGNYI